jgi:hypothetical protein
VRGGNANCRSAASMLIPDQRPRESGQSEAALCRSRAFQAVRNYRADPFLRQVVGISVSAKVFPFHRHGR